MPGVLLSASLDSVHSVFTVTPQGDPIMAPTLTHGEIEAQREQPACPESHGSEMERPGFEPRQCLNYRTLNFKKKNDFILIGG